MHKKSTDNKNQEQTVETSLDQEKNELNEEASVAGETAEIKEGQDALAVLNGKIAELEKENAELKDNYLRKQAEFENFRKRLFKDKEDSVKFSNQMLLLDITETIDNFERALKSAETNKDFDAFHNGVQLIEKNLVSTLESKWNVKRFNSEGEAFDPEKHQAIAMEDSTEHDSQVVLEDFQKGYLYYDRVLRPAKVKVCNPVAGKEMDNNTTNKE